MRKITSTIMFELRRWKICLFEETTCGAWIDETTIPQGWTRDLEQLLSNFLVKKLNTHWEIGNFGSNFVGFSAVF